MLRRVEREYRRGDELRASLRHALGLLSGLLQSGREPRAAPAQPKAQPADTLFERSPFAALLCDGDRRVTSWNPAAEKLFGIPPADALGRELAMLVYPGNELDEARARTALRQALAAGDTQRLVVASGPAQAHEWTLAPLRDAVGAEIGTAGLVQERDATAERHALAWEAAGDVIWDWDLAADRLWLSPAWETFAGIARGGEGGPSEWLDRVHPDDRDAVNSALLAHLSGASPRFESEHRVRRADESFCWVLARGRATRDGAGKAVRLCGSMMDLAKPPPVADSIAPAAPSAADAVPRTDPDAPALDPVPIAAELPSDAEDLSRDASQPASPKDHTLGTDLHYALPRRQLRVEYLPVIALATGRIQGLEALLRWVHPTRGVIAPAQFMPFAEESGLIVPFGRWLLHEAARDFRRCVPFVDGLKLHVNLSPRELQEPGLVDDFEAVLAERGLSPQAVVLEIAESVLQDDQHGPRIAELHERGFGLSVDDFGIGACTLESLFRFPFDSLKIDRSLFGAAPQPQIIGSIVELARGATTQAIAEGVETAEQLAFLRELGCPAAQGFYLSPPVDAEGARALLARSDCLARTA
ncbi:MAG: EAL domain-containing protein [Myxococcales bacterium]|nr:EAL domain-containing protein [Myxococcales bacterium]